MMNTNLAKISFIFSSNPISTYTSSRCLLKSKSFGKHPLIIKHSHLVNLLKSTFAFYTLQATWNHFRRVYTGLSSVARLPYNNKVYNITRIFFSFVFPHQNRPIWSCDAPVKNHWPRLYKYVCYEGILSILMNTVVMLVELKQQYNCTTLTFSLYINA